MCVLLAITKRMNERKRDIEKEREKERKRKRERNIEIEMKSFHGVSFCSHMNGLRHGCLIQWKIK